MTHPENGLLIWAGVSVGAGFATMLVLEVARHLQYLRHRDSGYVPSTQHWCFVATVICFAFCLGAFVLMVLWGIKRFG